MFENFDPSTNFYMSLNWLMMYFPLILFPYMYWFIPSRIMVMWMIFMKLMYNEFKIISMKKYQSNILIFISLINYLLLLNFSSLMPYIFTITSHMNFNLTLSLSLWLSFMLYGIYNMPYKMLIHLVPLNTPMMLMNFMVLIELISNFIRPWTLAIRLTANLIAGHLLLTLLGTFMSNLFIPFILLMIFIQNLLMILEISMAFIQSYVFSILSILYFSEFKK
uniref:ATP synthase subunit a n=1 Tax=Eucera floralia TaxID=599063 RepID=A0A343DRI3_9HYME|nr:ATP synthase F0 subunit 6 [Eucera floralia]